MIATRSTFWVKPSAMMITNRMPALGYHVRNVILRGTLKNVGRIATGRVVAGMQSPWLWPTSVGEEERDAMGTLLLAVYENNPVAPRAPCLATGTQPWPALIGATSLKPAFEALPKAFPDHHATLP